MHGPFLYLVILAALVGIAVALAATKPTRGNPPLAGIVAFTVVIVGGLLWFLFGGRS